LGRVDLWKGYLSMGADADVDAPEVMGVARVLAHKVAPEEEEEEEVGAAKDSKGTRVYP
jgi:hypothetical protein